MTDSFLTRLLGRVAARLGVHKILGNSVVCCPCHSMRCEGSWARGHRWVMNRYQDYHLYSPQGNPDYKRLPGTLKYRYRRWKKSFRAYHYARRILLYPFLWRQYLMRERRLKQQEISDIRLHWRRWNDDGSPRS